MLGHYITNKSPMDHQQNTDISLTLVLHEVLTDVEVQSPWHKKFFCFFFKKFQSLSFTSTLFVALVIRLSHYKYVLDIPNAVIFRREQDTRCAKTSCSLLVKEAARAGIWDVLHEHMHWELTQTRRRRQRKLHLVERTKTSSKYPKMRAKVLFFIVTYMQI